MNTKEKAILLTGASSGIGKEIAVQLLKNGYKNLYASARRTEEMADLREMGARILFVDVSEDSPVKEAVDTVLSEQGRIDVLINNAGYGYYSNIENADMDGVRKMYEVNFFGYIRMIQQVLPHMRNQRYGTIINMSSVVESVSTAMQGWYASTKHAIGGMTDALRQEVANFGINVVLIRPGIINTPFEGVAVDHLRSVSYPKDYQELTDNFVKFYSDAMKQGSSCTSTAKAVIRAIESQTPRTRYVTTQDAKQLITMRKRFSDELYDKLIMEGMGLSWERKLSSMGQKITASLLGFILSKTTK